VTGCRSNQVNGIWVGKSLRPASGFG
jgi:hypothetical protein